MTLSLSPLGMANNSLSLTLVMLNYTLPLIFFNSEIFYVFPLWPLIFCLSINFVVIITVHSTLILINSKYRIVFRGNLSTEASVEMVYILFTVSLFLLDPPVSLLLLLLELLAFNPFGHPPISGMLVLVTLRTECYGICSMLIFLLLFLLILIFVNIVLKAK